MAQVRANCPQNFIEQREVARQQAMQRAARSNGLGGGAIVGGYAGAGNAPAQVVMPQPGGPAGSLDFSDPANSGLHTAL